MLPAQVGVLYGQNRVICPDSRVATKFTSHSLWGNEILAPIPDRSI
jgi:hypothetical protein